jgi:hypothetical protein
MLRLIEGNVLLKRSHRKQLMTWLKRVQRLGQRLGDFVLTITLHRSGKAYEVTAVVHDRAGDFDCRRRQGDWRTAVRELVRDLSARLHQQFLERRVALA